MLIKCLDDEKLLLTRRIELIQHMNETAYEYLVSEVKDASELEKDAKIDFLKKQYGDVENPTSFIKKLNDIYTNSSEFYGDGSKKKKSKKKN